MTHNPINLQLKESVTSATLSAIEDAKQGLLSPHWQAYHFRELSAYEGTSFYPENGDQLIQQLQQAIDSRTQISDLECTKKELQQTGAELLFYYANDYDTFMEILFMPQKGKFTCDIGLDWEIPDSLQLERIEEMKEALTNWVKASGIQFDFSAVPCFSQSIRLDRYPTLNSALLYLFSILNAPTQLMR